MDASSITLPQPDRGGQTLADGQRKGDFKAVRENVREYAPAQRRPQADRAGVLGVYYQKPDGAEGIAHRKTQQHGKRQHPCFRPQKPLYEPHDQCGEHKSDDISAGASQKNAQPPGEARKHRQSDDAHK